MTEAHTQENNHYNLAWPGALNEPRWYADSSNRLINIRETHYTRSARRGDCQLLSCQIRPNLLADNCRRTSSNHLLSLSQFSNKYFIMTSRNDAPRKISRASLLAYAAGSKSIYSKPLASKPAPTVSLGFLSSLNTNYRGYFGVAFHTSALVLSLKGHSGSQSFNSAGETSSAFPHSRTPMLHYQEDGILRAISSVYRGLWKPHHRASIH